MLENKSYRIVKMHICGLEKKDNLVSLNIKKYAERICILDEVNKILVDVKTCHQYPYIKVINRQYFMDKTDVEQLNGNQRFGCMEYATIPYFELKEKELKRCKKIIKLLSLGFSFPNGNAEYTNEEYLSVVNSNKVKKIGKKKK